MQYETNEYGQVFLGYLDGREVWVSSNLIAQEGINSTLRAFGMKQRFPVVTDLNGGYVMVEAETQQEAIDKYLKGKK